ncbi:phage tail tape measure protein [Riemerella anatipestifer]|uniref:phage tail tape measure protein n=1 Tax=Riemerella anatipestifer TaxID=34085 RepID=UPI0020980B63|nr:phage tail tape measure protein [Riemerella anatipestifer]MCO7317798.1 phage tail tape measure protein [Riemerella anatipestifer]MCW0474085.1 phage tail tape measure protein [Riemerella anatipestifer]MDY3396153.1 phage tail tape measure protein [Riemerella anatipestifer]MDY3408855.1 phage tail tape measure protein [Riemerella anatipestifer]MDY3421423.1 phage tail tape measure protein [Riemerella anatipestifer]
MAKKISDEILSLKVVVNGDEAQSRILALERANNKLSESMEEQKRIMKELRASKKKNSEEYSKAEKELENLTKKYGENLKAIEAEVKAMDIMSLTMQQLRGRARDLQHTLSQMNPNHSGYKSTQLELEKINSRMGELKQGAQSAGVFINSLADKFNRYSGMATAVLATFAGIAISIQSTIDLNNKLSDAQTAVAKTTGMTDEAVKELTKSFNEFDTRTSKLDLLKIAEVGGRLGVPKEQIKDFTREVDKAYVALGDSFSGGVEQVANKIGKIKGLFKETKDLDMATAINQIGSSLNELGASGAASEANIAEFATRVGALPGKLKPTVAEAMALGAAFEENGIDAERSATAYSNFVRRAAQDTQGFAEVMNLPIAKVKELINTNPTEFFLKFSEGMRGLDATQVAAILDKLKLNDQYLTSIVGAAGDNTDKFRNSIELSNQALQEATSLQEEFNKVNNNAAAIYEKVRKKFISMFTSEAVVNTLTWLIATFGKLIGAVEDTEGKITAFRNVLVFLIKMIVIGTVATLSYNTAIYLSSKVFTEARAKLIGYSLAQNAHNIYTKVATFLMDLWNLAVGKSLLYLGKLTNSTNMQTMAQQRLNLVTKLNPFGILITVVMAAITAYTLFADKVDETTEKQKLLNEVKTNAANKVADEKAKIESLLRIIKDENQARDVQQRALNKLNAILPERLRGLTLEKIKTQEATAAIKDYINQLDKKAMAEALHEKSVELKKQRNELNSKGTDEYMDWANLGGLGVKVENLLNAGNLKTSMTASEANKLDVLVDKRKIDKALQNYVPLVREAYWKRRKEMTKNFNDQKSLKNQRIAFEKSNASSVIGDEPTSNYNIPNEEGGTSTKGKGSANKTEAEKRAEREARKFEEEKRKLLESAEKFADERLKLEELEQTAKIELMKEGYEKELAIIEESERKKLAELEKQKYSQEDFKKLDEIISKSTKEEKQKFEAIKEEWESQNNRLTELKLQEIKITELKKQKLEEEYKEKNLKKQEENFQREIFLLRTQENEKIAELETLEQQRAFLKDKISTQELSKIRNWEDGKVAIQRYYQEKSLDLQANYLKRLIKELDSLPPANLTEAQTKALEAMKARLAEIGVELNGIKNGKEDAKFSSLSNFGGQADIFGLTPEQWEAMFENTDKLEVKIQKIGAALEVAKNIMATYHAYTKANQEAELRRYEVASERKKKKLQAELDAGIISQQEYKHKTIAIENELAIKKWQLEVDEAKREKDMKKAEIVTKTAMGIMSIWEKHSANPILAGILTAAVTALGGVQYATVAKQPLPAPPSIVGAESGYYPVKRVQDGKLFRAKKTESKSGIYDEPTMLVGEQGKNFPELVVSGRAMKRIDPKLKNDFMREVYRVEGFENGKYPQLPHNTPDYTAEILSLLQRNTQILEKIEREGVRGVFEKSARMGKELEDMQKDYRRIVEKNKH